LPTWALHRLWGERICSYYSSGIDSLVDRVFGHDSSRYDVETLEKEVDIVASKHGDKGLCYLSLHHYLDRLVDLLVSTLSDYTFMGAPRPRAYEDIRYEVYGRLLHDPKNLLSALVSGDAGLQIRVGVGGRGSLQRLRSRVGAVAQRVLESVEGSLDCIICSILIGDARFESRLRNVIALKAVGFRYQPDKWEREGEELLYQVFMEACERCLLEEKL